MWPERDAELLEIVSPNFLFSEINSVLASFGPRLMGILRSYLCSFWQTLACYALSRVNGLLLFSCFLYGRIFDPPSSCNPISLINNISFSIKRITQQILVTDR